MKTSEQLDQIFTALAKAQGEFKVAKKDTENPFFKKNYADLESIVDSARPSLSKNGLSFVQFTSITEGILILTTRVCHSSGQWIEGSYPLKPQKDDPQSLGAALTYAKRNALKAALGIVEADEDDDAESEMERSSEDRAASKQTVVNLMKAFSGLGVSTQQILSYLGVQSTDQVKEKDIQVLTKIGSEIKKDPSRKSEYFK